MLRYPVILSNILVACCVALSTTSQGQGAATDVPNPALGKIGCPNMPAIRKETVFPEKALLQGITSATIEVHMIVLPGGALRDVRVYPSSAFNETVGQMVNKLKCFNALDVEQPVLWKIYFEAK